MVADTTRSWIERRQVDSGRRDRRWTAVRATPSERRTDAAAARAAITARWAEAAAVTGWLDVTIPSRRPGFIADAAHGQHDFRSLRILLDLGAQPLDVHVDEAGVRRVSVAPDLFEQHLTGEDLPGLSG